MIFFNFCETVHSMLENENLHLPCRGCFEHSCDVVEFMMLVVDVKLICKTVSRN